MESGLKLDLNRLARDGFIRPGALTGPIGIVWTDGYSGDERASGLMTADMTGTIGGWFRIQIRQIDQRIDLLAETRHFGGRQWYFVCPYMHNLASVLWMPPGANSFASRARWGAQVAYTSQFLDRTDRAHRGQAKIRSRLCSMGSFDADEWDFPPKPKWMRWSTYHRADESFDRYEAVLNEGMFELLKKLKISL